MNKYFNILVSDEHVKEVREIATSSQVFPNRKHLIIPLSPTGQIPITHWFCTFKASSEDMAKLKSLENLSEMHEGKPKEFIIGKGLKVIHDEIGFTGD